MTDEELVQHLINDHDLDVPTVTGSAFGIQVLGPPTRQRLDQIHNALAHHVHE